MPSTVTTEESISKTDASEEQMRTEVDLRIRAGAIRSRVEDDGDNWRLVTEWNVIGQ